jgi:DNA processing protein
MHRDLDSWQRLGAATGIGPVLFRQLLARFGSPEKVLAATEKQLRAVPGIDTGRAQAILQAAGIPLPHDGPSRLRSLKAAIITYQDRSYPQRLLTIYDYPALLYIRGSFQKADEVSVAVVGSRRASPYGQRVTRLLVAGLVQRGITVVSGLARGIDSVAHRMALERGGRTIAVLGSGIDVVYPAENTSLADRIADSGAVVSEFPLGTDPEPGFFPRRNRIISGLSLGVVVIEAGDRSGALVTAHYAADQGREVYAVPGPIDQPHSRGPHHLIQEGAKLVRCVEDIVEEIPQLRGAASAGPDNEPEPDVSPQEKELLNLLTDEPVPVDQIIGRTGRGPSEVLSLLLSLEMKGLAQQLAGKRFVRK